MQVMKNLSQKLISKFKKNISELGHVTIKDFFSDKQMESFENSFLSLYLMQAKKIGEYKIKATKIENNKASNFEKISAIFEMMEKNDKEALYQVQHYMKNSISINALFDERFLNLTSSLLSSKRNDVLLDGPALFINRPDTKRLLYKWHSESHYYPKRRRFLNIWLPLFNQKTKANGTMSFKEKSHKSEFPFSDYVGYNNEAESKKNSYTQYEIPSKFVENYKEYFCETSPKDLVIFHRSLVHKSNINNSNKYSLAAVARVWDPSDDLTLSGAIDAQPYKANTGRSNLDVNSKV